MGCQTRFSCPNRDSTCSICALHNWFARLCQRLAIEPTDGGRAPCLMSFRHTFAVTCMQRWYQQGLDVQALLPHLSVYLGHVHPQESYWYLTAVPELLSAAAQRFQAYAHVGGDSSCLASFIAPHVQAFFADYLCQQKRLSPQTILSCRDTFRLLLTFLRDHTGVEPSALRIADVDAPVVLRFLDYLEQERGNSVRSRNIRLSAIRSFFRLVALRDPDSLGIVTRVLAIPMKREDQKLIGYLTRTEIQALLAAPDRIEVGRGGGIMPCC